MKTPEQRAKAVEATRRWRERNPDKAREGSRESARTYRQRPDIKAAARAKRVANPAKQMVKFAKARATANNLPFDITEDDIEIPEFCPYLGIRLEVCEGKACDSSPSLDKIDNAKGYVRGNVQVISYKANTMKRDCSIEELLTFADAIRRIHG